MKQYKQFFPLLLLALLLSTACSQDEVALDGFPVEIAVNNAPFEWTRAEDVETRSKFLRNFGLGYGYDAVRGEYCNWQDIRCQVVSREVVEKVEEQTGEMLMGFNTAKTSMINSKFEYSFRDYVANVTMTLDEKVDLGLYNETKRRRQHFIEDGYQEKFYYSLDERITFIDTFLSEANLLTLFKYDNQQLLTQSFINAVLHLAETDDSNIAAVDSFLNVWGTHVIVESWLGGKIRVDLMNELWRYYDQANDSAWSTQAFLTAVEEHQSQSSSHAYKWLEDARLNITAWGGDQSTLTGLLGEHKADGTRTFSIEGINRWVKSLRYDPLNEINSTVEMIDMRLSPIWLFVEAIDKHTAKRVQAAVTQDASMQQALLGNVNFFNAAFPIRYKEASCLWHGPDGSWKEYTRVDEKASPMVVNIVSGGRYVATVCHETINGIDLWVCYPIYEGRVNLACGVGVAEQSNEVYDVQWINGEVTLIPEGIAANRGMFYITDGAVGVRPAESINYEEGHAMPYFEYFGGVRPDGSYDIYNRMDVMKEGDQFYVETLWRFDDIVGWTYLEERENPKSWPSYYYVYTRDNNYYYIYNPNEMRYE